jgi:AcrR family transcriptional regulator
MSEDRALQDATLDLILDTARSLIAESGYATLTMGALAKAANLPLSTLYRYAPDRPSLMAGFMRRVDLKVLDALPEWSEADPPRDRLFDLLMARFEASLQEKDMLRVVQKDLRRVPGEALLLAPALIRAMRWMAEAAGLPTSGLRGAARIRALAASYASILPVWLGDEDAGHARTMAALDRRLRRAESLWPEIWGSKPSEKTAPPA